MDQMEIEFMVEQIRGRLKLRRKARMERALRRKNSGNQIDSSPVYATIKSGIKQNDGGPGSGNHGHAGVPGQRGGSAASIGTGKIGEALASGKVKSYTQLAGYKATKEQHEKADEAVARYRKESGMSNPADYSQKYVGTTPEEYTALKIKSLPETAHPEVREVYEHLAKTEQKVTADLQEAMSGLEGMEMREKDLRFRMKEGDSFERKVNDIIAKSVEEVSPREAALKVDDAIRYTTISEPEHLVENFQKTVSTLQEKGYEMVHCENLFKNTSTAYNVISTNWKAPDGSSFELWFHTPDTKDAQDGGGHAYYEALRWKGSTPEEKGNLGSVLYEKYYGCKMPDGIEKIDFYDKEGHGSHY